MSGMRRRLQALGIAAVLLSLCVTASAPAGGQQRKDRGIESKIDSLLRRMTLEEKLNQLTLLSDGQMKANPAEARKPVGSVFSETDPVLINKYQRDAVENSRLGIPILFAFDTIHGFRTIFPIPLGTASSFDPDVARADHRIGAFESAAVGLKQIYSPMVDLSHEPRWGRIAEAAGEDPYLNSVMAAARVKGRTGPRLQRAGQGRDERQALRRLRRARRRPRLQHDRHVAPAALELLPAALQGRHRCRVGHAHVLVQRDQRRARAAPTATWRPTSSSGAGASTASSRATTPRWPSCAPARVRTRPGARAATAWPRTAPKPPASL